MQNLLAVFTVYVFDRKHYFRQLLTRHSENCQFQLKFYTKAISNIQNSMVVFTFFALDGKHPFLGNLVQKIPIVSFCLNLVP